MALFYSAVDLGVYWRKYGECARPLRPWLLFSFAITLMYRFSLPVRAAGVPWMLAWTVLGMVWLKQTQTLTPQCLPDEGSSWFTMLWLLVCALLIFTDIASMALSLMLFLHHDRRLNALANREEILRRWGPQCVTRNAFTGLSPTAIAEIPLLSAQKVEDAEEAAASDACCSICLEDFAEGEAVRALPSCSHHFHQP